MVGKHEWPCHGLYRIEFGGGADMDTVEDLLGMAILAVECLHGEPAVRLEAGYGIRSADRVVVLEGGSPMAQAVARVFVGLSAYVLGDDAFRVIRHEGTPGLAGEEVR